MERDSSNTNTPILFGRSFLKTVNTKIDCGKNTLSMGVEDEVIEFNFYDAMKYSYNNVYSITCYNQIDECVALSHDIDFTEIKEMKRNIYAS
jgi:hypothetical protein